MMKLTLKANTMNALAAFFRGLSRANAQNLIKTFPALGVLAITYADSISESMNEVLKPLKDKEAALSNKINSDSSKKAKTEALKSLQELIDGEISVSLADHKYEFAKEAFNKIGGLEIWSKDIQKQTKDNDGKTHTVIEKVNNLPFFGGEWLLEIAKAFGIE